MSLRCVYQVADFSRAASEEKDDVAATSSREFILRNSNVTELTGLKSHWLINWDGNRHGGQKKRSQVGLHGGSE